VAYSHIFSASFKGRWVGGGVGVWLPHSLPAPMHEAYGMLRVLRLGDEDSYELLIKFKLLD
jgi:hypothetical protein